ncbi:MAG: hypothetical protein JOZ41_09005 [Chloroflexi bacterium]|nr:hypothetical protein [Chloroflexota bacterium]
MVKVQEASFIPNARGGEIKAVMTVGSQQVMATWPLGNEDGDLRSLLESMMVRLHQITFVPTPSGGEIRATMSIGERNFISRLPVEGEDQDLKPSLSRLLDEIGRKFVQNLQAELDRERGARQPERRT